MALKQTKAVMDDLDKAILGLTGLLADVRVGKKWKFNDDYQRRLIASRITTTLVGLNHTRNTLSQIQEKFARHATDNDGNYLQP